MASAANLRESAYRLLSAAFVIAALYHLTALLVPGFSRIAYSADYPRWRHLVFILLDLAFAKLLLMRPKWLVWPLGALTIQVLLGHGLPAWELWQQQHRIDWISVLVVVGMLGAFTLIATDSLRPSRTQLSV